MRLSDVSIKNPVMAWMIMAALIVFGAISFSRLGVSQLPDADFPVLNVSFGLEGASPEVMESTVVDPVEDALMTVEGVRNLSSSSKSGSANITVEFELGRDIDVALQEVQTKVAQAQRRLPKEVDPPVISKSNPDDQPILWLALTYSKDDPEFLMRYARDVLKDRFTTIPGVGEIILGGYTDPVLRVWLKPDKLTQYNISVNDVIDAIQSEHAELPGGQVDDANKVFNVRTLGEAKTVEEFGNIIISRRAGQLNADPSNMLRLKQVAEISEGLDEIKRMSRFNGESALGLGIRKQRGSNAVAVARAVKEKAQSIQTELPEGMSVKVNFDSTKFIENSIRELTSHLVIAALLTAFVCWIFLGSWSATFNVLLSIPTSIMGTFIGLYFFGFTLNTFTLLGLTLAIGIVVDDAIMVLENIFRYNEKGHNRIQSAILGSREIAFAAMAATVAVVAIFLPVAFMKGVIGKYFLQFGLTISLAVMLSLLEALTITPMRAAAFLQSHERTTKLGKAFELMMDRFEEFYKWGLALSLKWRWSVIALSVIFLAGSFYSVKFLKKEFTPSQDMSLFLVRLQLPPGTAFSYTNQQTKLAEEWLQNQKTVKQVYASIGGFGGGGSETNTSVLFVSLLPKKERENDPKSGKPFSQEAFMDYARKELSKIKDVKPRIQDLSSRGFSASRGFPIELMVKGADWDELNKSATAIMKAMEDSGMMVDVDSNYLLGLPEIQIMPDRVLAALHGVSVSGIGKTVNSLIGGVKVGQYPKGGKRYDIRLKVLNQGDQLKELRELKVGNNRANLIPISQVVSQEKKSSLQQISRVNRQRAISIYANLKPGASQQAAMNLAESEGKKLLPVGYSIEKQGSAQTFKESFDGLIFALILGFFVAYMVLASQFNSFIDPIAILMALPFSISGAFFALLITQQSLNIYSMIGILLLMGIVKKNSILLVEFANQVREHNRSLTVNEALMQACPVRLRPIIMTSFATIAGAVPSAMAMGEGSETSKPMALTIIGGVLVSTFLTLYVVPVVYSLFERIRRRDKNMDSVKEAFKSLENRELA
jgi:multidrug efflux pump